MNLNKRVPVKRWALIIFGIGLGVIALFWLVPFKPYNSAPISLTSPAPHVYKNPTTSIAHVEVKVFYAIPANKVTNIDPAWHEEISATFQKAAKFHALQFHNRSTLNYEIFRTPIILHNNDLFYDTTSTDNGNPHALINIGEEINRRVFVKGGDLYNAKFSEITPGDYAVMAIIYEGVGASGGIIYDTTLQTVDEISKQLDLPKSIIYIVNIDTTRGFFVLNHDFLTRDSLKLSGGSILYHEFAHTIGLPDLFDQSNAPLSDDIMGQGRNLPIEDTYIGSDLLRDMGAQ